MEITLGHICRWHATTEINIYIHVMHIYIHVIQLPITWMATVVIIKD